MVQVLLVLSVVFSIYSVLEATCPVSWTQYDTNCYKFGLVPMTWPLCRSTCAGLNATMLCIPDATTNAWLWEQTGNTSTWIGLSDIGHSATYTLGTYTWFSGCSSTYTNWDINQPDNLGIENYVYFYTQGKWDNFGDFDKVCACEIMNE
jgi:hypothetical protein